MGAWCRQYVSIRFRYPAECLRLCEWIELRLVYVSSSVTLWGLSGGFLQNSADIDLIVVSVSVS